MELNATIEVNLENGKMLLVLLVNSMEDQLILYRYLLKDIGNIKQNIICFSPLFDYVTTGHRSGENIVVWDMNFIPLVKC